MREFILGKCFKCDCYGSWQWQDKKYVSLFCDCEHSDNDLAIVEQEVEG